ncbi:MAG: methyl-accepting chemotaxis protein, partial [Mariprofundaceae bacterium]|nr:methyl-accepting chemotaxis protein [Mariprofundaceae bacterium]
SMKKNRSLKNMVLVERAFRMRQIWRVLLLTLLSVLISTVALAFFYAHLLELFSGGDMPLYFAPEELQSMSANIPGMQETMIKWLLILGSINAVITMIAAVFMTYKLGGPLYRLKADMYRIGEGDLSTHIHLRKGDEYQDVADSINDSVAHLHHAVQGIQTHVQALHHITLQGEDQVALNKVISDIESELDYFTLSKKNH